MTEPTIRLYEAGIVRAWLPASRRVLEIGAGEGLQAAALERAGHVVHAVDLPRRARRGTFAVIEYDGSNLPFATASFDVVYSSMVMQMLDDPTRLLTEARRVARSNALHLHAVPTVTWRIATSLAYPLRLLRRVGIRVERQHLAGNGIERSPVAWRRLLVAPPQGASGSAVEELRRCRRSAWKQFFEVNGFDVHAIVSTRVFYTGVGVSPEMSLGTRRLVAAAVGSSSLVVVATARDADEGASTA